MKSLVEGLLKYSRLGDKGAPARVNLNDVLGTVLANLEASIVEQGAVITHSELPTIYGDEPQLEQLLQNLIANAIKYRRRGGSSPNSCIG